VKRHSEVLRARLVVESENSLDTMRLVCEVAARPEGLAEAIGASLHEATRIRGRVELAAPGALPNDGKVIEDARRYD
jgi:phenylacetate-CoA ligase